MTRKHQHGASYHDEEVDDYVDDGSHNDGSDDFSEEDGSGSEGDDDDDNGEHNQNYHEGGFTGERKEEVDRKWEESYEKLLEYRMEHGHCNVPVGYKLDAALARWVALNRAVGRENRMDPERKEKLELIGFSWGFFRDKSLWEKQFDKLRAYKKKHGDCKVPRVYEPDRSLGTWVKNQRYRHRNNMVKPEERRKLESIGFDWGLNSYVNYWKQQYGKLILFVRINGHTRVPKTYAADQPLSDWVSLQRHRKRNGKMTEDRAQKLDALGFEWQPKRGRPVKVKIAPQEQQQQQEAEDFYPPSQDDNEDDQDDYPEDQREEDHHGYAQHQHQEELNDDAQQQQLGDYHHDAYPGSAAAASLPPTHGAASPEVAALLEAVAAEVPEVAAAWATDVAYSPRIDHYAPTEEFSMPALLTQPPQTHSEGSEDLKPAARVPWEVMYQSLEAYKLQHGDCLVPRSYDKVLSTWVETQRSTYRAGTIPDYRRDRLNALGFVWATSEIKEQRWNEMFERLVQYKAIHGTTLVPRPYEDDPQLSAWAERNRQSCTREDRIAKLASIDFVWPVNQRSMTSPMASDEKWQEMYDTLVEYKRFYSDCLVPRDFEHFPMLGVWVETQRAVYRGNTLALDRIQKLNDVDFVWDPSLKRNEEAWDSMLDKLVQYKAVHGDCSVPRHYKEDPSLGGWVGRNRYVGRIGTISEDRKKKLDAIGFNWGEALDKGVWEAQFDKLIVFRNEFGHCRVPLGYKPDVSLGNWVKYQRQRDKMGLMDADQRDKLNFLEFSWCQTLQPKKQPPKPRKRRNKVNDETTKTNEAVVAADVEGNNDLGEPAAKKLKPNAMQTAVV